MLPPTPGGVEESRGCGFTPVVMTLEASTAPNAKGKGPAVEDVRPSHGTPTTARLLSPPQSGAVFTIMMLRVYSCMACGWIMCVGMGGTLGALRVTRMSGTPLPSPLTSRILRLAPTVPRPHSVKASPCTSSIHVHMPLCLRLAQQQPRATRQPLGPQPPWSSWGRRTRHPPHALLCW
jgi:hypothetical protein